MGLLAHRPSFDPDAVPSWVVRSYGLEVSAAPLPSERDQNFLVSTTSGERFVLKIANAAEDRAFLEAQEAVLDLLARAGAPTPRIVPTVTGQGLAHVVAPGGVTHLARLVTWREGTPLGSRKRRSEALFRDLGRCLGQVDRALSGYDHPALHRDFHWDLARGLSVVASHEALLGDDLRRLVTSLAERIGLRLRGLSGRLRTGVIHNDANDHNVLVGGGGDLDSRGQQVTGLLDFGDMIHGWVAAEPAIAAAYAMLDAPDPLAVIAAVAGGYHEQYPLDEAEIAVVFPLACLRLCVSACIAADQQRQRPDDEYLGISQGAIRRTLPSLARIPDELAEAVLREACGLAPVRETAALVRWLDAHAHTFAPVLHVDLRPQTSVAVDLGVDSPLVSGDPEENDERSLGRRIFEHMKEAGAEVGLGRYGEARLLYTSPRFAVPGLRHEWRTVHLGVDLFAAPGTPVRAPTSGVVHALSANDAPLDYGTVVILRHATGDGLVFHTLYGHVNRSALEHLAVGQPVQAGEAFAWIGEPSENGGWPPHLHFQLITDPLGLDGDFPGVCHWQRRGVWQAFSPDPTVMLGVAREVLPPPRADKAETLAVRRQRLGGSVRLAYRDPVKIVRGWKQHLWDETGRRYLDAYNNVPHVGHCHPRVVEAGRRQMALLNTNTRYLHDLVNEYAARLVATLPAPLRRCFFVNSASEANELALRLARAQTGARDMVVLEAAYHGHTTSLIDLSPYKHAGPGGEGPPDWVHTAPLPDVYRGAHRRDDPEAGHKYAVEVKALLEAMRARGRGLAGFIAETCPSVGGQIFFPEGYLAGVYRYVREAGGVCIADEVQTGLGRIGTHFWAFEAHAVVPDIVVMGKPLGNGHPIGAVVTTEEIAAAFDTGMEFFSTFGGNPVSCAIGLAVLDVVRDEGLQAHARHVGERLLEGLRPLVDRFDIVGDVRGSGLFLGVELVRDRKTLAPAGEEASFVANRLREMGILLGTDGPHHNVIKIRPPMPFTTKDARTLVEALEEVLDADFHS